MRSEQELRYRALCMDGLELALLLSNAITLAEHMDAHAVHWGVFEANTALQTRCKLKAWQRVQTLRRELHDLVQIELHALVAAAADSALSESKTVIYQRDLQLRKDLAHLLNQSSARLTQEETLALLAMWSATTPLV